MAGLGTVFVELSLDDKVFKQKLSEELKSTEATAKGIEMSWKTLGLKSDAMFQAEARSYQNAMKLIENANTSTQADIFRARQAMNAKLKALQDEQTGHATKSMQAHEGSMASLTRSVLRLYAAYYVLQTGISVVTGLIMKGVEAIDTFNLATVKNAAIMVGMMKPDNRNLADRYKEAYLYAGQLNKMLEEVDKNTMLNFQDLQNITVEMMKQGVVVNTNSKAEIAAFTQISNALATISQGSPNKEIQLRQEARALLKGQVKDTDQLAQMIDAQLNGKLKEQIALHKRNGDLVLWLGEQLKGFAAAQEQINASWETARSTLETTVNQVLRDSFKSAYSDIIKDTQRLSEWAIKHKSEIADIVNTGWMVMHGVISGIGFVLEKTIPLVSKFKDILIGIPLTFLTGPIGVGTYAFNRIKSYIESSKYDPDYYTPSPGTANMPTLNPAKQSEEELQKAATKAEAWAKKMRDLTTEIQKASSASDELADKIETINNKYTDLMKEAGLKKKDSALITQWRDAMVAQAEWQDQWKKYESQLKERENSEKQLSSLMNSINESEADSYTNKVRKSIDDEAKREKELVEIWAKTNMTYQEYLAISVLNEEKGSKERLKIRVDEANKMAELAAATALYKLDIAEKSMSMSRGAIATGRAGAVRSQLFSAESTLAGMNPQKDTVAWQNQIKLVEELRKKLVDLDYAAQSATGTFSQGLTRAIEEYGFKSQSAFEQAQTVANTAFQSMENSAASFLDHTSDKFLDFRELAISVINDIYKEMIKTMLIKPVIAAASSGLNNLLNSIFNNVSGGTDLDISFGGAIPSAKGNVFNSPSLKALSNSILTSPVIFPMAKGYGLAGEAGYEAVMPLTRTSSGDLGVKTTNGDSGSKGNTFIVHLDNPTFQDMNTQQQVMAQIAEVIARRVAPDAIIESYSNDDRIRSVIRERK